MSPRAARTRWGAVSQSGRVKTTWLDLAVSSGEVVDEVGELKNQVAGLRPPGTIQRTIAQLARQL